LNERSTNDASAGVDDYNGYLNHLIYFLW
jgi:hypothetical protein